MPNGIDCKDVKFEEFSVTDKFLDEKTIEIVTGISAYNRCFSVTEVTNIQNWSLVPNTDTYLKHCFISKRISIP